ASFPWEDIGDFGSLRDLLDPEGGSLAVLGDRALVRSVDSRGIVVPAGGRTIAVVGLEDVVVVDTGDALLVTTTARAQEVKGIVAGLRSSGRDDLT
ncbi:MAG: mannose-1-phosphate guanylyltransferase, partial [Nocardioides sp.]|nr:mannose-1-phosphate guanylyltransferase [Nocardioides sp.]